MLSVKQMCYYAFLFIVMVITSAILPLGMSGQTAPKALTQNQIIELLKGGVPSPRVESLVSQDGIAFAMTHAISTLIRQAGASDSLIKALWQLSNARTSPGAPPAAGGTSQPRALADSPAILQIKVKPGGTQVYIDDELMGSTSSRGRLKLSQLTPGQHNVRLALLGYRDFEQDVTLVAGKTAPITATLEKDQIPVAPVVPTPPPPVTSPVATPVTPATPVRTIPNGTEIAVRTNVAIDSKTAAEGQKFSAVIDQDVLGDRVGYPPAAGGEPAW